jgi:hypothetical protein
LPIDALLSLAHTMVSATGTQALLLGSGVSRSAQVPTGWEVTLDLVRRVALLAGVQAGDDPALWFQDTYGDAPDYSGLIESLAKTPAERRALLQAYFEPTQAEREAGIKTLTPAHMRHPAMSILWKVRSFSRTALLFRMRSISLLPI